MRIECIFYLLTLSIILSCSQSDQQETVLSPDEKISFSLKTLSGQLVYEVKKENKIIIAPSKLGFRFKDMPELGNSVKIINTSRNSFNETWEQPWGEKRLIENRYEELVVYLQEKKSPKRIFNVIIKVFNDGIGFRYVIPEQKDIDTIIIMDELTEFKMADTHKAWWIPAYKEKYYESLYRKTDMNKMDTVCVPLTLETNDGSFIAIHEANLTDYAAMNLFCKDETTLKCDLTPWSTGEKVIRKKSLDSPWRTITFADYPGELITSYIMLNLNEPSKIVDQSWLKTGKYIGIWWGMHINKFTWQSGPKHGATNVNTTKYIDFAANNGFDGVLTEGWNLGWDGDWVTNGDKFSFIQSYPDFDMVKLANYAASKNIELIGHHETGGATLNYENQIEEAFKLYNKLGIRVVKTGYVNPLLDKKEYHSSQYGVRHFRKVIETAARNNIIIDNHEPVMPTGLQRTFPNLMTQEGVRGQEYDAWSSDGGNPPEHTTIIPFTRGLAGPMDFTPGTFDFKSSSIPGTRVQTTIAKQLALYVVIYSPLQMASDLPENYINRKEFNFIREVPTNWEDTKVLKAKIGDYITIVRKDRNSEDWYLGSITDENNRSFTINLSFLDISKVYKAQIYKDGDNADWKINPDDFGYEERNVTSKDQIEIRLANGGGQAIRFTHIKEKNE